MSTAPFSAGPPSSRRTIAVTSAKLAPAESPPTSKRDGSIALPLQQFQYGLHLRVQFAHQFLPAQSDVPTSSSRFQRGILSRGQNEVQAIWSLGRPDKPRKVPEGPERAAMPPKTGHGDFSLTAGGWGCMACGKGKLQYRKFRLIGD